MSWPHCLRVNYGGDMSEKKAKPKKQNPATPQTEEQ